MSVPQLLTPRRAACLVLRRAAQRTDTEADQLTQLHAQSVEIAEAIDLAQDFTQLVRERIMKTKHKMGRWFCGL